MSYNCPCNGRDFSLLESAMSWLSKISFPVAFPTITFVVVSAVRVTCTFPVDIRSGCSGNSHWTFASAFWAKWFKWGQSYFIPNPFFMLVSNRPFSLTAYPIKLFSVLDLTTPLSFMSSSSEFLATNRIVSFEWFNCWLNSLFVLLYKLRMVSLHLIHLCLFSET